MVDHGPEQNGKARRERILRLKAEIEAGTYVVDPDALSQKIVDAHLARKKKRSESTES